MEIEKRTIEELFLELRTKNNWTYIDIMEKLSKHGIFITEKTVKKWEIGLIYPSTQEIYKLSEIFMFPAENFIMAKSNSYKKGMDSIHVMAIKWFCYITGASITVSIIGMYILLFLATIYAFVFFTECVDMFMRSRRKVNKFYKNTVKYWRIMI